MIDDVHVTPVGVGGVRACAERERRYSRAVDDTLDGPDTLIDGGALSLLKSQLSFSAFM